MAIKMDTEPDELQCLISEKEKKPDNKEDNEHCTSWWMTGVVLANIILGLGLLSYPHAFKAAGGVIPAFFTQTICLVPLVAGFLALGKASLLYPDTTFQDMLNRHCGVVVVVFCNIIIFVHNYGSCVTFLVMLADQIDETFLFCFGSGFCDHWFLQRHVTMPVISFLFILPCCFMKHLNGFALKCISVLGILTTGYIVFLVVYKYYVSERIHVLEERSYSFSNIVKAIPTICFSFEAHVEAVPLYSCLKKKSMLEISKAITFGLGIALTVYSVVGVFGFLATEDHVTSDLLLSFYPPDVTVIIGTALMGVKAISTYPAIFFCVRVIVDDLLFPHYTKYGVSETRMVRAHTVIIFVTSVGIAVAVPTIGHLIMLLGGTAALIILVFPGFCLIKICQNSRHERAQVVLGVAMVVGGTFLATVMTLQSILKYSEGADMKELVCTK